MNLGDTGEKSLAELKAMFRMSFRRYWKIALIPAVIVGVVVLITGMLIPNYYTSEALMVIQPQRISSEILKRDSRDLKDEIQGMMDDLSTEILSRSRLRSIIDEFNLYPDLQGVEGKETAIRRLKAAITIDPVTSQSGRDFISTYSVSFSHTDPNTALKVTDVISKLFREESSLTKQVAIQGTEEFLEAQLNDAKKKLEVTEDQLQKFERANFGRLPDHLTAAVARLQSMQSQLDNNQKTIESSYQRRQQLRDELANVSKQTILQTGNLDANNPGDSVSQLEAALVVLRSKYSEQHPDVVNTKKRLEGLRAQGGSGRSGGTRQGTSVANPLAFTIRNEMNQLDVQITTLENESKRLKDQVEKLQQDIEAMPIKDQELVKIKRDYANIRDQYDRLSKERERVAMEANMYKNQKGTQLKLVNLAELPIAPAGPPRLLITIGGIIGAVVVFLLVPIGAYYVNGAFKFKNEVESDLGIPVFGVIPPVRGARGLVVKETIKAGLAAVFALNSIPGDSSVDD